MDSARSDLVLPTRTPRHIPNWHHAEELTARLDGASRRVGTTLSLAGTSIRANARLNLVT
jgi:hypothetical protein